MNLRPIKSRIIVEQVESEEKSAAGLILSTGRKKHNEGKVIAAGPGRYTENGHWVDNTLKVGDHIYFGDGVGMPIVIDGKDYLGMNDYDVEAARE